jgi:biofilm PGA synthesis N-glycosyltransferase PgaC
VIASATALASLGVLAYTYAGYPLLVGALSKVRPRRDALPAGPPWRPRVTVCLPTCNCAGVIEAKLASLTALDYPRELVELLVYDDGSTDDTRERVRAAAARDPRIVLIEGGARRGKPSALNAMRARASGEVLLMTDARQPLSANALADLVDALADPEVGCAAGNLVLDGDAGSGAYWRYERWIRQAEARFRGMVGVSGALYAVRKADLPELPEDCILDDMFVPMSLVLAGRRLVFCAGALAHDQAFDDDREFGRKVRTLAGNFQLIAAMPELLVPGKNPLWLEFVSHKVLRLACPAAMAGLAGATAVGSLLAPGPFRLPFLALGAGQLAFYGAALAGPRAGKLGKLARTFVVLNAAAVVGAWSWARGRQKITW